MVWLVIAVILGISLLPHIGIVLLSFAKVWSFSLLPTTYTLGHYEEILFRVPHFVINTLIYTLLAAALDIVLGATIAFLLLRSRRARPKSLDAIATMPLAIPGVVLAVGYLRVFHGWDFPGVGAPLTSSWLILVVAYTMRRLPYTVRACYAALQQVHISLEESAQNLGANRFRTFIKITLPMISGGLVAGGLDRLRHFLRRTRFNDHARAAHRAGTDFLRHLSLHAESTGAGRRCRAGCGRDTVSFPGNLSHPPGFRRTRRQRLSSLTMNAAEVRLENIGKRYGEQWVVRGVNLHIQAGRFLHLFRPQRLRQDHLATHDRRLCDSG